MAEEDKQNRTEQTLSVEDLAAETMKFVVFYDVTLAENFCSLQLFVCFWRDSPQRAMASSFTRFSDHTQRLATDGRTPLDD